MQQSGFEWLFRLYQEPRRLWKRYLVDFFKFGLRIWPSVLYRRLESAKRIFRKRASDRHLNSNHITRTDDEVIFSLPSHLNPGAAIDSVAAFQSAAKITFDFTGVKSIDADGIGTLARIWQQAEADGKIMNLSGLAPYHKQYLAANCLTDYFANTLRPSFSYNRQYLPDDIVLLQLFGILDTRQKTTLNYLKFLEDIGQQDCIFDMSNLSYIGSSGLMLMLNISKHILSGGNCFVICSPCRDVKQLFQMTDLKRLFIILPDKTAAQSFIHEVRGDSMP
jgi:anti-anti-sigma factor